MEGSPLGSVHMRCVIIAEAGVNHNGSLDLALRLLDAAATAGADAVKFQTFRSEALVAKGAAKAAYQKIGTGDGDQLSMLRALELPLEAYPLLKQRCHELGLQFLSTPFDSDSADFLVSLGMTCFKVPSGELTHFSFLKDLAQRGFPLIVSTGMAHLEEVRQAVNVIRETRDAQGFHEPLAASLTLLHCTSNYPAAFSNVNLKAMQTLQQEFGLPVGYSDHTVDILIAPVAVALGAQVIEKHFTLDHSLPGPDHQASLEPDRFVEMVKAIRNVECALGSGIKEPQESEIPIRAVVRRSVTLQHFLQAGASLTEPDLVLLRPGHGIQPSDIKKVLGRRVLKDLEAGHTLEWSDLAE